MNADTRAYLDTSALAKWYLNETNSDAFVSWLQDLDVAVVSSLTHTEMRSLLSRRRRMGELTALQESVLFAAFLDDVAQGWLQLYPIEDSRFAEAAILIARYPDHPIRTLDPLHLAVVGHAGIATLATADPVMAEARQPWGLGWCVVECALDGDSARSYAGRSGFRCGTAEGEHPLARFTRGRRQRGGNPQPHIERVKPRHPASATSWNLTLRDLTARSVRIPVPGQPTIGSG